MFALPTIEVVQRLQQHAVIECAAGSGLWMRILRECGVDVIGIDKNPRGTDVIQADHTSLRQYRDRLLLVVWPPDGTDLQEWVDSWGGEWLAVCGCDARFIMPEMDVTYRTRLSGTKKGRSSFVLGKNPKHGGSN